MKILLTGSNGMLGTSLTPLLVQNKHQILSTDINIEDSKDTVFLDVRNLKEVSRLVNEFDPDVVMHLAAETDVDICEQDPDQAYLTNVVGTQNVAIVCQKKNIPILYMSSVGVFDGDKNLPYIESDEAKPINVYGVTKLEGEKVIQRMNPNHFIFRAGWMFGGGPARDKKFVGKIIKQALSGAKELVVVNDKVGTPTFTTGLAIHLEKITKTDYWGTYHCSCKGVCSRVDVAKEILRLLGLEKSVTVKEVSSANYPLPARRPYSESMDNMMLRLRNLDEMKHWKDYIKIYINEFI